MNGKVGAFFDLDGTLIAGPSLERRFLRVLRYRRLIGLKNYLWWAVRAIRLAPRGSAIRFANKMYLRGVQTGTVHRRADVTCFFAEGIERVAWHAEQGHTVAIVSGTLEPLAREAARELEVILFRGGITAKAYVCATRLEEKEGKWTGVILGEAMYGEAKARVIKQLAAELGLDLKWSYGYGDSVQDRWLLEAVGLPVAVNPSAELGRITQEKKWTAVWWNESGIATRRGEREVAGGKHRRMLPREVAQWERESLG